MYKAIWEKITCFYLQTKEDKADKHAENASGFRIGIDSKVDFCLFLYWVVVVGIHNQVGKICLQASFVVFVMVNDPQNCCYHS